MRLIDIFLELKSDIIFCGLASHSQLKTTLSAAKIEFLQLREDSSLKAGFTEDIGSFWAGNHKEYSILSKRALNFLIQFLSTYCCEVGFSVMVFIKTKYRNRLEIDDEMRCCISYTQPRFERLIAKKPSL